MAVLNVDLVATDRKIWSGQAQMVSAPAADGDIGILPGHSPVLAVLRPGAVRIRPEGAAAVEVRVTGGYLSVDSDQVMIVADGVSERPEGGH